MKYGPLDLLNLLLPLERPILIFDTETTGPDPYVDRIVEIGHIQIKPDGFIKEWRSYINPEMPIPQEATEGLPDRGDNDEGYPGHGITDAMVADAPTFRVMAPHLLKGYHDCDYGGYGIKRFDLPLLKNEFKRVGHEWSYDDARVIDCIRLWQLGRPRTLTDAVKEFLDEAHDGAHGALADVRASLAVIVGQLLLFSQLPRDLKKLHELQYPRDPNALDVDGKIIWDTEKNTAVMNFGKNWKGKRLDLMGRRDLQWIIDPQRTGISDSVKHICEQALLGNFPTKPRVKE